MKIQVLKVTEEGHCEKCGRPCPRRRVVVQRLCEGGGPLGEPEAWGVNCVAQAKYGSKSARLQSVVVAEADAAERDRLYNERQKLARVAVVGQSYQSLGVCTDAENIANWLYRRTGRGLVGSYFARNVEGHVVRVDGIDPQDVDFYGSRGFVQFTKAIEEALL